MENITKQQQKKIKEFFKTLEKVRHFEPLEPGRSLFDLGLVVFEPKIGLQGEHIYNSLSKEKAIFFQLNDSYSSKDFLKNLVIANHEKKWLVVDLKADPSQPIIQVIKQLSQANKFTINHFEGQEIFNAQLNSKTRVIVCVSNDFLETEVTYPYFSSLFGLVLRI